VRRADSLLTPFIRDLGIEDSVRLAEIKRNWYSLFQKPLSYHIAPSLLSRGELLINVDSPVWLQELKFYKEGFLKKLGPYGVSEIRFRLGRVSLTNKQSEVRSQGSGVKHLTNKEHTFIQDIVSKIEDERLKVTLKTAIEKAINSGKTKIR
jgi:hypothetical protein